MMKTYQDMKKGFWWPGMNKDMAKFVQKRLACQQAKAEPQRSAGTYRKNNKYRSKNLIYYNVAEAL